MGETDGDSVLDLYRLAVEMADRVSARRASANAWYVSLETATLSILGLLSGVERQTTSWVLVAVAAAGACIAVVWLVTLRSYQRLNSAKFAVIQKIEDRLPVQMYKQEWAILRPADTRRRRYHALSAVERTVPVVFLVLNLSLALYFAFR